MDKTDEILQVLKQILGILQRQEERAKFDVGLEERMAQRQREIFEAVVKFDPYRRDGSSAPPPAVELGLKAKK